MKVYPWFTSKCLMTYLFYVFTFSQSVNKEQGIISNICLDVFVRYSTEVLFTNRPCGCRLSFQPDSSHVCFYLFNQIIFGFSQLLYLVQLQIGWNESLQSHRPFVDKIEEPWFSILFDLTTKLNKYKILLLSILTTSVMFSLLYNFNSSLKWQVNIKLMWFCFGNAE